MSLFKRKNSPYWWVKLNHKGRRVQQSTGTPDKVKAREYHDKLKSSLWDQERLGIKPSRTWNEAVVRYLAETSHKASQVADKAHLRWVDRFLGGMTLGAIDRELLDRIHSARAAEGAAYVGKLARAGRNAAARPAGAWRVGVCGDGEEICSPVHGSPDRVRGPRVELETGWFGRGGYKSATRPEMMRACISASPCFGWRARSDSNARPLGS